MNSPDAFRDAEFIADVSCIGYGSVDDGDGSSLDASRRQQEAWKRAQRSAKVAFIDRLLRDLDILIYCELSALYYMDCSVILFAVRAIVQLIFFTPKASPFDPTRNQPFIGAIFASNLFCMLFHHFFTHPQAGEETRGYLHGGLFIDFIGEKTPVSGIRLLSLDVLILIIDFIMLGLIVERVKITKSTSTTTTTNNNNNSNDNDATTEQTTGPQQDHDAEERGILRQETDTPPDEIELESLDPRADVDGGLEHTQLLAEDTEEGSGNKDGHALDLFSSGEAVIMDMGLVDLIRDQWRYTPATVPRRTSSYVPSNETATFLRERFGLQVGTDGRIVPIPR
ncbi:hypothetical protein ASPZODRAFT_130647 [Penicilliopsis zonata CBS 506.65]|uniref:DUF1746 domain-containing protein n=1 Tax=Penicilliopsis zonata CBS 506.65 TaxID=1073090 RepID=A0A1L9SN79_9EURO|nr:hypothetical protein ASPZODRAFT_130647 [Penicilliopsis zonata CBS 506.65]OJJ48576.1 hypothetical protein ASPZODRAFT_130647 [Penicilliopsis zonata CBS 506.65]